MVENFIKEYAKLIADYPNKITTQRVSGLEEGIDELIIFADKSDTGKLIGRDGKMINSIKTVINGYKAKDGISYKVTVKAIEE